MVVIEISGDDAPELVLVQSDEMIEAVAAQGSDQPLHERVLPRTSRCADNLLDPVMFENSADCYAAARS